jgi:hypothetical protein
MSLAPRHHRVPDWPTRIRIQRRIDSLAFNLTTMDTPSDMGPLEIQPWI